MSQKTAFVCNRYCILNLNEQFFQSFKYDRVVYNVLLYGVFQNHYLFLSYIKKNRNRKTGNIVNSVFPVSLESGGLEGLHLSQSALLMFTSHPHPLSQHLTCSGNFQLSSASSYSHISVSSSALICSPPPIITIYTWLIDTHSLPDWE